jgi:hypothetical protein
MFFSQMCPSVSVWTEAVGFVIPPCMPSSQEINFSSCHVKIVAYMLNAMVNFIRLPFAENMPRITDQRAFK